MNYRKMNSFVKLHCEKNREPQHDNVLIGKNVSYAHR